MNGQRKITLRTPVKYTLASAEIPRITLGICSVKLSDTNSTPKSYISGFHPLRSTRCPIYVKLCEAELKAILLL